MMVKLVVVLSAAVLIVATWVLGTFLGWPLWLEIVLSVFFALSAATFFVVRWLVIRSRARALEQDMMAQADKQAMAARPDRRAELIELQLGVKKAISALKSSKLGSQAGGPLYALPWYMIVGPPGAGKTTALRHSGLNFPVSDPEGGGAIKGIGGTRNCDWWFTNEGILLDTAGRYVSGDEDQEEWLGFLEMLRKHRPAMPINGILVAVALPNLVEIGEEEAAAMARRLRSRIDEVMTRLKMVLPIYVMFTKADLIAGFAEFFDDLRRSDRAQIWGASFPISPPDPRDPRKAFGEEFDGLAKTVFGRAMQRLGNERSMEGRHKIFHFPLEYRALKSNLTEFVGALFERNAYQETPVLRGMYFSSGTQEGHPVDRVLGAMMRAFDIAPPVSTALPARQESKSYFVTDMFKKVVFPDAGFAARSEGERRRQVLMRVLTATAAVVLGAVILLPTGCSYANNRELVSRTDRVSAAVTGLRWLDGGNVVEKASKLDAMRDELKQLDTWKSEGAPLEYRWGMYVGNDLQVPLRNVYVANLHTGFAVPTKQKLEEELRSVSEATTLNPEQYNAYFNRLKAYLQACDRERLDVEWESTALTDGWTRTLTNAQATDKTVLRPHASYYIELMKKGDVPTWDCDVNLITRMRAYLKRLSAADRDYSALVRDANEGAPPITRDTVFLNTAFGNYITSRSKPEVIVTGAYTKAGWDLYVRDRLGKDRIKQLMRDRWVLGETEEIGAERAEKQMSELRERYFATYQRAWADFLKDFDVRAPQSNDEALEELSALSEIPWPYQRLLRVLDDNTHLEEAVDEKVEKEFLARAAATATRRANNTELGRELVDAGVMPNTTLPKRWESPVEIAFRPMTKFGVAAPPAPGAAPQPTSLGHYQERIVSKVVAVLTDLRDSKGRGVKAEAVTTTFEEAIRGANELLNPTQSGFTRPLLSPLLMRPLELGYGGTLKDLGATAGGNWENEVWKKWRERLEDGYPFTDTWKDVQLTDYTEFFKPGGTLFKFYNGNLKSSLELMGDKHVPTTRFGQGIAFTSPLIRCYDRGLEISKATFDTSGRPRTPTSSDAPAGDGESAAAEGGPDVEFEVNLHSVSENVSEVVVEIDGASHTYRNGPEEWLSVRWPAAKAKDRGSRVKIRGFSGLNEEIIRPGEWGWFRLLDGAKTVERGTEGGKKAGRPVLVATWQLRSQPGFFKLDIRPAREENPFNAYITRKERIFRGYTCPRVMAGGGGRR